MKSQYIKYCMFKIHLRFKIRNNTQSENLFKLSASKETIPYENLTSEGITLGIPIYN